MPPSTNGRHLGQIVETLPEVVFATDLNLRFTYVNRATHPKLGYSQTEIMASAGLPAIFVEEELEQLRKTLTRVYHDQTTVSRIFAVRRQDGACFSGQVTLGPIQDDGKVRGFTGCIATATEQAQLATGNTRYRQFEDLLADLASHVPVSDLDQAFEAALGELGSILDIDRAYLFQIRVGSRTMVITHSWIRNDAPQLPPDQHDLPLDILSGWLERLRRGHEIRLSGSTALPAPQQAVLDALGAQALLICPVYLNPAAKEADKDLAGFIRLDACQRDHPWQPEEAALVTRTAQAISEGLVRWRAQEALRAAQERYQDLFDNVSDILFVHDSSGVILSINSAVARVLGYSPQEVIGRPIGEFIPAAAQGKYTKYLERIQVEEQAEGAVSVIDKQGKPHLLEYRNSIIAHQVGNVRGSARDITEQKAMEQALREQNQLLEETLGRLQTTQEQVVHSEKMASIGQLAAGVAHEINNPMGFISSNLNTIGGYAEDLTQLFEKYMQVAHTLQAGEFDQARSLAAEALAFDEQVDREFILQDLTQATKESRDGADRVKKIVLDLRDFSRAEGEEMAEADLNEALASTLNILTNEIKYKATVVREFGDIPPVMCHVMQLQQVFMNILVNAAQAIPEGGKGVITVRSAARDDTVSISISDTGGGIKPENIANLFDPFFTTKPVGKGTGLGLSISYGIVTRHGGQINVESEVGQGTTFTIELPVDGPPDDATGEDSK